MIVIKNSTYRPTTRWGVYELFEQLDLDLKDNLQVLYVENILAILYYKKIDNCNYYGIIKCYSFNS